MPQGCPHRFSSAMKHPFSGLDSAVQESLKRREARSELLSSALFGGCVFIIFAVLLSPVRRPIKSFALLRDVFIGFAVLLVGLAPAGWKGMVAPDHALCERQPAVTFLQFSPYRQCVRDRGRYRFLHRSAHAVLPGHQHHRLPAEPGIEFLRRGAFRARSDVHLAAFMRPTFTGVYRKSSHHRLARRGRPGDRVSGHRCHACALAAGSNFSARF